MTARRYTFLEMNAKELENVKKALNALDTLAHKIPLSELYEHTVKILRVMETVNNDNWQRNLQAIEELVRKLSVQLQSNAELAHKNGDGLNLINEVVQASVLERKSRPKS